MLIGILGYVSAFMFPFFMYFVLKRLKEIRDLLNTQNELLNKTSEKEKTE